MLHAAELAEVQVPVVAGLVQTQLVHTGHELVVVLLTLAAADELADAGDQHIGCGDGLAVGVLLHVEALDLLRVVGDEDGLLEHHLGQVALVLGLDVHAPLHGELELLVVLLQDLDGVGVADAAKLAVCHQLKALDEALVDELVEESHLIGAVVQNVADDVLGHGLGGVHVAVQIAERHLRLDHPELGGVAGGKALLSAEGGAKGVHLAERHCHGLGFQLAGNGQVDGLLEEVLGVIDGAVFVLGDIVEVEGGDAEHLAGTLTVGSGQQGGVSVDKAVLLEELVDGVSGHAADAESGVEGVGARAQGGHGAQILHAHLLFLQRILVGGAVAQDLYAVSIQLERLLCLRSQHDAAHDAQAAVQAGVDDLIVVCQLAGFQHDLQGLEAAAVGQGDKADVLGVADVLCPAAYGDDRTIGGGVLVQRNDLSAFHSFSPYRFYKRDAFRLA